MRVAGQRHASQMQEDQDQREVGGNLVGFFPELCAFVLVVIVELRAVIVGLRHDTGERAAAHFIDTNDVLRRIHSTIVAD